MIRDVIDLTVRGPRSELVRASALRLQAALLLIFLAARCVHLGQAGIDLLLAHSAYRDLGVAIALGVACIVESGLFAVVTLRAGRLGRRSLLGDALFGVVGLGLMAVATGGSSSGTGTLNWMLAYTVATAAGLGLVTFGEEVDRRRRTPLERQAGPGSITRYRRMVAATDVLWPPGVVVLLGTVYITSLTLPGHLSRAETSQIWTNAANYAVFFSAAILAMEFLRRRLGAISRRNAELTGSAAELAEVAQWRAVAIDVFGPVLRLLDRAVALQGPYPGEVRDEADRLIGLIEAVRPPDDGTEAQPSDITRRTGR
jgi:hypothetical protein